MCFRGLAERQRSSKLVLMLVSFRYPIVFVFFASSSAGDGTSSPAALFQQKGFNPSKIISSPGVEKHKQCFFL